MRRFFLFLFFLPAVLSAQLDKIKPGMSVEAFVMAFPNAQRDLDAEAIWITDTSSIGGIAGNSRWRIYNDSISEYRFNSQKAKGPSHEFPRVDSTEVHNMRVALKKVQAEFEMILGKPTTYYNYPLVGQGDEMTSRITYLAEWSFPDEGMLRLTLTKDVSIRNRINAPDLAPSTSEAYEMTISVSESNSMLRWKHGVGLSSDEFFKKNPAYKTQAPFLGQRIYNLKQTIRFSGDTTTYSNTTWEFIFIENELKQFSYDAYAGTEYGAKSDEAAYKLLKLKTEQLLTEANSGFGKADTMSNALVYYYQVRDLNLSYQIYHLYGSWSNKQGNVLLTFIEVGGGKNPSTTFRISVAFVEGE